MGPCDRGGGAGTRAVYLQPREAPSAQSETRPAGTTVSGGARAASRAHAKDQPGGCCLTLDTGGPTRVTANVGSAELRLRRRDRQRVAGKGGGRRPREARGRTVALRRRRNAQGPACWLLGPGSWLQFCRTPRAPAPWWGHRSPGDLCGSQRPMKSPPWGRS